MKTSKLRGTSGSLPGPSTSTDTKTLPLTDHYDPPDPDSPSSFRSTLHGTVFGGRERLIEALLPVDRALIGLQETRVSAPEMVRFLNGQSIGPASVNAGLIRVYGPQSRFLGIAESGPEGELSPRRVFHLQE